MFHLQKSLVGFWLTRVVLGQNSARSLIRRLKGYKCDAILPK